MLDERHAKLSKIASPKGFAFVARWLYQGVTAVDALVNFAGNTPGIKNTEVLPILRLFASMGLLQIVDDTYIEGADQIKEKYGRGEDFFSDWFIEKFVDFALEEGIINIEKISYSIDDDAYIMASTTIKPKEHACYRNILTDYEVITLLKDNRYLVNGVLDKAIKTPHHHRRISEAQLKAKLQQQAEQGERGELYVVEFEKRRITKHSLQAKIQRVSLIDVSAGFDIVSFNSNESSKIDRFIEVKTYRGSQHFHWSENEIKAARIMGDSYYLYLVDDDCIDKEDYEPVIIKNPHSVIFSSGQWLFEPDSYSVERVNGPRAHVFTESIRIDSEGTDILAVNEDGDGSVQREEYRNGELYFDTEECSKVDLCRVINAVYEAGYIKKQNRADKPHKKDVFHAFGKILNINLDDYTNNLRAAKSVNNDSSANGEIFDKLKSISERLLNKAE